MSVMDTGEWPLELNDWTEKMKVQLYLAAVKKPIFVRSGWHKNGQLKVWYGDNCEKPGNILITKLVQWL